MMWFMIFHDMVTPVGTAYCPSDLLSKKFLKKKRNYTTLKKGFKSVFGVRARV